MSNVIQFLESLGNRPALSAAEYAANVAALDVDVAQQRALLDRDQSTLGDLLGRRTRFLCSIFPADEPVRRDDEPEEQPAEETPAEEE